VWSAHPELRGVLDMSFTGENEAVLEGADAVFLAVNHGDGMAVVDEILSLGFEGIIVDLSADFRLADPTTYRTWYGKEHLRPDLLEMAFYGLPEIMGSPPKGTRLVANPGCFATAISLALHPVTRRFPESHVAVTALTGASGSGMTPGPGTHFPDREGNVRAYNVMRHRHQAEVRQIVGAGVSLSFVPVSGPWTHGIWGTATVRLPEGTSTDIVSAWFEESYDCWRLVRLSPGALPELRHVAGTPFCDLGWIVEDRSLVVGFALDNLLKGAATQAIQNLNLLAGLADHAGLVPQARAEVPA
jgi:N-acetyl-gamma-glutamyl-phosphate reductase